jgi:tetratricopeptide (TPR) repeat protein
MTSKQDLYQQAVAAIQAGDLTKAREILSQLLQIDHANIDYWLWMSAAVETTKERIYCLREVLLLDPENQQAAQGLHMLGEKAPELNTNCPVDPLIIPWKTKLEIADAHPPVQRGLKSRIAIYSLLGVVIIGIFIFGISLALKPVQTNNAAPIKHWTITPLPTATETPNPTASSGPAPLSIVLDTTFTPTAIYVATPHNRLEAYSAGMRAYAKGDWDKAANYLKQVLTDEPNSADIYYHLGDTYRFKGSYADALAAYQTAIKIDPNFAPGYLGEAQVYIYGSLTKLDKALTDLQKAVSLDPQLNQAYLELANVSLIQNDPDSALGWLDKLDTDMPDSALIELYRAKAYLARGDTDQALTAIKKANQYDRSLLPVYPVWAQVLQANGDFNDSIVPLLTSLANEPGNQSSKNLLARAYFETGDSDKALTLVNECLQSNDKFVDAYLLRGDIYLSQSQNDEAQADFSKVLNLDTYNFYALIGIGRVALAKSMAGSAFNDFDFSQGFAKTDAQKATALYWRAVSLQGLNETSAAVRDFESALGMAGNSLAPKLRQDAEKQLASLYTPTPSLTPSPTPRPSRTPTITPTQK